MQIIPLSEGAFTIDKTKIFVPFELEQDDLQQRPIGSLLVEVQPFVVITEKDVSFIVRLSKLFESFSSFYDKFLQKIQNYNQNFIRYLYFVSGNIKLKKGFLIITLCFI
jgi:hypothetical protein